MKHILPVLTFIGALGLWSTGVLAADEIVCFDKVGDNGRGETVASVAEENGRLILSIFNVTETDRRLIAREGVAKRTNSGRAFDLLYIGRNAKLSVNTETAAGELKASSVQSGRPMAMICELSP